MKKQILFWFTILCLVIISGCNKEQFNTDSSQSYGRLTQSEVVGSYYFKGYSGPLKRELNIDFYDNKMGEGEEYSYGSYGLLSIHKYVFKWSISGSKVILKGTSASVDSDGDVGTSTSWEAEFEWMFGMLVPGKNFIAGYAEKEIFDMVERELDDYVTCTATLDRPTGIVTIDINSGLDKKWSEMTFQYGVSSDYVNYTWAKLKGGKVEVQMMTELLLYHNILKSLAEAQKNGEHISDDMRDLETSALNQIKKYESNFSKGNVDFVVGVNVKMNLLSEACERTIEIRPDYEVTGKEWAAVLDSSGNQGGTTPSTPSTQTTGKINGHEYVDLGLSVKWATCNVGASSPEEYGDYYAWGETEPKPTSTYIWSTYTLCKGSYKTLTKYNTYSSRGKVDKKSVLEPEDDVARVKLGGSWRMPTVDEWIELIRNCTWTWTRQGGENGYRVTSNKNGNSIFLPATGEMSEDDSHSFVIVGGFDGRYWSSCMNKSCPTYALDVFIESDSVKRSESQRCIGRSIRPVSK